MPENLAEKSGCVDVNHTYTPPDSGVPLLGEPRHRGAPGTTNQENTVG